MSLAAILLAVILLAVVALLMRVLLGQREAAHVARDTKSEASAAAHDAAIAAAVARQILDRLETGVGKNNATAHRIENAAAVVADDLAEAHQRADSVAAEAPHGAAADAAFRQAEPT